MTQREIGANRLQSAPRGLSDAMAPVVRLEIEPVSCVSFTGGTAIIRSVSRHLITRDAAGTPPDLRRRGIRSSSDDPSATGWDLGRQIPACRAPSTRRMASEPPRRADRPRSGRVGLHPVQVATLGHRHPGKVVVRTTGSTTRRSPSWREAMLRTWCMAGLFGQPYSAIAFRRGLDEASPKCYRTRVWA